MNVGNDTKPNKYTFVLLSAKKLKLSLLGMKALAFQNIII